MSNFDWIQEGETGYIGETKVTFKSGPIPMAKLPGMGGIACPNMWWVRYSDGYRHDLTANCGNFTQEPIKRLPKKAF